jgi:uncharacterized protein
MEVPTPAGPAVVHLDLPDTPTEPGFLLVLTHGAGGGVEAPDLLAVRGVALGLGGVVARVLQPYRVAGRRVPGPVAAQDQAWLAVVAALRRRFRGVPLIVGGRSNGARVACRTAARAGARGVVALAFPLHPPWNPGQSREAELRLAAAEGVEVVVVTGDRDPFGVPDRRAAARVHVLTGEDHELARDPARVGEVVGGWLRRWAADSPGRQARAGDRHRGRSDRGGLRT